MPDVGVFVVSQKEKDGRMYYTFEFASKASNYIRHALAVVTVANGALLSDTLMRTKRCLTGHLSISVE